MNLLFHLSAAMALLGLGYWVLTLRRQRELLRLAFRGASRAALAKGAGPRRIVVDEPRHFLESFATAFGLPFERETTPAVPPGRIEARALVDLFLSQGITLIRWKATPRADQAEAALAAVELHVAASDAAGLGEASASELARGLGGRVLVEIVRPPNP